MRIFAKGGVPPCDRRLDRRKVAIAATAALFIFATATSHAATVDFEIDMSKSFVTLGQVVDLTGVGIFASVPQVAGSDTAPLWGNLSIGLTPGVVALQTGSTVNLLTTGVYAPGTANGDDPPGPPPSTASPGNAGFMIPVFPLFLWANFYQFRTDFAATAPYPLGSGGGGPDEFDLTFYGVGTQGLIAFEGAIATVSTLGNGDSDAIGDPIAIFGTGTNPLAKWDGTTLTIPISSSVTVPYPGLGSITYLASGTIVATPKVPEPSSMVLLGFGVVGLLTCGWRMKKRRALVA